MALNAAGLALAFVVGEVDGGAAYIDRALALNPNLANAWLDSGWINVWLGEPELAIEHEARAIAWLSVEPLAAGTPHAVLRLTIWPGGETRQLAACDHHGRWSEWL